MSWFLVILLLSQICGCCLSEAGHDKKPSSAVVVGTVYCDTCFQQDFSMGSHFISGASVAVECKDGITEPKFRKEVKTNDAGEFRVELPFSVSKHVRRIKGCSVKLVSSSEPYCAVASAATSSSIRLKSRKQGLHIFSAGFFSFKPLKLPNLCNQKPSLQNTNKNVLGSVKEFFLPPNIDPSFPSPSQDPNTPGSFLPILPPLPTLPKLPPLPPLPPLPGISTPRPDKTKTSRNVESLDQKLAAPEDFILPPNPLLPPPTDSNPFQPPPLIPNPFPNPLQPPAAPRFPTPFQPPQSPFFSPPPVPGFTTPSPFPFFPLPPSPSIPGAPPASSTKDASP
ncbi:hypothetical protein HN51_067905 [Arachis hypogaea]|uniref:proline-rich receptor-like protein kinase PERK9 n=1 Tax=Arachis ipaensis TaxID=130454 RepID=UPI0007AF8675|nr:proline-rich receptor-like protein kinase PERK9 [Arachis ipaensis]XP_025650102.1 proline-rich receptor-like protein kinase PERK9 [Arachis hypogaea]QHO09396.1 uncharacterized protein DS421_14g480880 [Arachis hypogaea]